MIAKKGQAYVNLKQQIYHDEGDVLRTAPVGSRWVVSALYEDGTIKVECDKTGALIFPDQIELDRDFVPASIPLRCPHCEEYKLDIFYLSESVPNGTGSKSFTGYYAGCTRLFTDCPDTTGIYPTKEEAVAGAIENDAAPAWEIASEVPASSVNSADMSNEYRLEGTQGAAKTRLTDGELLDSVHLMALTQTLARTFYCKAGYDAAVDYDFRSAMHPQERLAWDQACAAVELFRSCDMEAVMDEYDADVEEGSLG